jgi:hypothetical protein
MGELRLGAYEACELTEAWAVTSTIGHGGTRGKRQVRRVRPRWWTPNSRRDSKGAANTVADEVAQMGDAVVAKTASRQVLGVMNEFVFMAEHSISSGMNDGADLLGLSIWLAGTIVGPLTKDDGYIPRGALECWQPTLLGDV